MKRQLPKKRKTPKPNLSEDIKLPLSAHIAELRSRLLFFFFWLLFATFLGFVLHPYLLTWLILPLSKPLYYSSPAGGLTFIVQLSLFFGILLSIPMLLYQTALFIKPAFVNKKVNSWLMFMFFSYLMLLVGIIFAYTVSLPATFHFLDRFSPANVQPLISTTEYMDFVARYFISFGLIFQVPLILLSINAVSPLSWKKLQQGQRWVILGSAVFAAILTPTPDMVNQVLLALPLILLYEISVALIVLLNRYHSRSL